MTIVPRGEDAGRREEGPGKVEAEVEGTQPQGTECQEPPEAEGSKDSPLEAWRECGSADTFPDFWLPGLW